MGHTLRIAVCGLWLAASACSSDPTTAIVVAPERDADVGDVVDDGGTDALDAQDEGLIEGGDGRADASAVTVNTGLYPTPTEAGDLDPMAQADAVLTSFAAGASALVVDQDWGQLEESDTEAWLQLSSTASYLERERKKLLFSVATVHASADSRPAVLHSQAWSSQATRQAMQELVDRVFATFGDELAYLSLGMEVDKYMGTHAERVPDFVTFMVEMLQYARSHPGRGATTQVGLTWSSEAWAPEMAWATQRDSLVSASDTVMLSFYGLDESKRAAQPRDAVKQLFQAIDATGVGRVVLHRVSFTTSSLLGGSETSQAEFWAELFAMVEHNRAKIPFMGVAMLNDPSPEDCLRFAQTRELTASAELYAYWCSTGLRTRDGVQKAAFSEFLSGASRLTIP